jgi:hypothetical protein
MRPSPEPAGPGGGEAKPDELIGRQADPTDNFTREVTKITCAAPARN